MNEDFDMKIVDEDIITKNLNIIPILYSIEVQMDTEYLITLKNVKEQPQSKFHLLHKN